MTFDIDKYLRSNAYSDASQAILYGTLCNEKYYVILVANSVKYEL